MMMLISCAKTMTARSRTLVPYASFPRFRAEARHHALCMARFSPEETGRLLRVSRKLAAENCLRFRDFCADDGAVLPALLAYAGIVFKRIHPGDFTEDDFVYAQEHLRITSFLYGLLRPLDLIKSYRMEGDICLPEHGGLPMFDYWKPLLTGMFIRSVKAQGGILLNLASREMKELFDWARVEREVRVITPDFQVWKGGRQARCVIYVKMCRGEMARFVIRNRIEDPEKLKAFRWEGFCFDGEESTGSHLLFRLQA